MKARIVIVGAGITGLATAAWLEYDHNITNVLVIDEADQSGGKMRSEIIDGHTIEWGPQGFLNNAPDTLELVRVCGLDDDLVHADEASADRFILREGQLRSVPTSPLKFMASDVLPLGAKLRLFGEPFARRKPPGDETVFDFAARRIGPKAAEILVDAMVTGVFAGDSHLLSLAATFPKMAAMEADHGSLTRALIAKMREARKNKTKSAGPAGPGGTLCTFTEGMAQLPNRLAHNLGDRLHLNTRIDNIELSDGPITINSLGSPIKTGAVLLATPAEATALMLKTALPAVMAPLDEIKTASIAVVMVSYPNSDAFKIPLKGFGFLIPGSENAGLLGALFCHTIFPAQAPAGSIFIRAMLGGARDAAAVSLSDDELVTRVRRAMASVYGCDPEPGKVWIRRHPKGISQYTVGHLQRVETIEKTVRSHGLDVAGSPYRGVSVNDCIKQARAAAGRLAEKTKS